MYKSYTQLYVNVDWTRKNVKGLVGGPLLVGGLGPGPPAPLNPALLVPHLYVGSYEDRVRSASNITVITRNLPRKLRVGKIENYP